MSGSFWFGVASGGLVGIAVGLVASYPVGYLRERGRQTAARHIEASDLKAKQKAERDRQLAAERAKEVAAKQQAEEVERLRLERVGKRFLHRVHRDDPGIVATVVDLAGNDPIRRVLVEYEPIEGREITPFDPPPLTNIEWSWLTMPDSEQRHRTARLFEDSLEDADGWLEYEPLSEADG